MVNVVRFIQYQGCSELLKRMCNIIARPFYENQTYSIFKLSTKEANKPDENIHVVELKGGDLGQMQKIMYAGRTNLKKRFFRGDRCFAVLNGCAIVSYFWVLFSQREMFNFRIKINLQANQAWMYDAITIKEARGKGLYPNIILKIAEVLKSQGIEELFVDSNVSNRASIRGIKKVGCRKIADIKTKKVLMRKNYLHVFDEDTWQQLSNNIEGYSDFNWRTG
jgi:hypothetical protein